MKELTLGQRTPLFELVRYQAKCKTEPVFVALSGWDCVISVWGKPSTEAPITSIPRETLGTWHEDGYITLSERVEGPSPFNFATTTFLLRQETIDYANFMNKPPAARAIITVWRKLIDDVPSLIWGFIGGSLSGIITALVIKWLGAT